MLAVALAACSSGAKQHDDAPATPVAPPVEAPKPANQPKVSIDTPRGAITVDVEVVATPAKIEKGLMYRQYLAPDAGMLFLMGKEKDWTFWMHNTLIPLDMIFIAKDMTVAGVVQNAEPKTDTLRTCGATSLYVLEVNGGYTASHGVIAGAKVRFDNVK
ncbi:MAG: DUF192 domain-containing protein [Deltaproteobacteria bacterium]|nr:DUF192 domain-containing protein [Deltaproteobacteria bacterium]